jgi:glucose-1-phosphate cytidylyltransferase
VEPQAIDYINSDQTPWEHEPLNILSKTGQLAAYRHEGFWQPMDTIRDKNSLEALWSEGNAPWKIWK